MPVKPDHYNDVKCALGRLNSKETRLFVKPLVLAYMKEIPAQIHKLILYVSANICWTTMISWCVTRWLLEDVNGIFAKQI